MHAVIFGSPDCPFCVRAKQLADRLSRDQANFSYCYLDIHKEGIDKPELSKIIGKMVKTVPQILIDDHPVGGYTEFEALMQEQFGL